MTDDTVLQAHTEDPRLVQITLLGEGGKFDRFVLNNRLLATLFKFELDLAFDFFKI